MFEQGRVAIRPGLQEKFLVQALHTIGCRANALAVGQQHGAHAAGTVIDGKTIPHTGQLPSAKQRQFLKIVRIKCFQLIMQDRCKFAERGNG